MPVKAKFYSKYRNEFTTIRESILSMQLINSTAAADGGGGGGGIARFLSDPCFDIKAIDRIYMHVTSSCKELFERIQERGDEEIKEKLGFRRNFDDNDDDDDDEDDYDGYSST